MKKLNPIQFSLLTTMAFFVICGVVYCLFFLPGNAANRDGSGLKILILFFWPVITFFSFVGRLFRDRQWFRCHKRLSILFPLGIAGWFFIQVIFFIMSFLGYI